ncbi:TnsD family transposase [Ferviditalea candida]|uniref:TnsD family transposase n=1 Tax=Ferviditalea candida TaxID=3108399 RepID=A0ABU5ZN80_9BACL|nr:TnsD family transposase [Paenibacillaceae bacterium T2]
MIPNLPTPYEDELLYSILARCRIRNGTLSHKAFLQDAFGHSGISASVFLPSGIDNLVSNLPPSSTITSDQLIFQHTMFPLLTAFLSPKQREKVYEGMKGLDGKGIHTTAGIMASSIKINSRLRFCRQCNLIDKSVYGEYYWHRMHQIPGLDICMRHEEWLQDSKVPTNQLNKHVYIPPNEENCKVDSVITKTPLALLEKYRFLSKNIESLLNYTFPNRPFEWFGKFYVSRLQNRGYASQKGRVDQLRLEQDFVLFYGNEFLSLLQSDLAGNHHWLSDITRFHRKSFSFLRHLLLMNFLDVTLEEIFYRRESFKPFGDPPWLCLNPAAEHYLQKAITDITLTTCEKTKKIIGTFACSCGFIYTRKLGDDPLNKSRVKEFGKLWESECKRLAAEGFGLREIGRRLQADPMTVKKCLENGMEGSGKGRENKQSEQRATDCMNWLQLQEEHPELSKTELRKLNPGLYARLYRNDRSWLEQNSPASKIVTLNQRVDWSQRDKDILQRVQTAVDKIMNAAGKPRRLTMSKIGALSGAKALLEKHLDRLPETKAYLNLVTETEEQFRIRKINWAIKELGRDGVELSVWRVLRKASIRTEHCPPDIEELIRIQDFNSITLSC